MSGKGRDAQTLAAAQHDPQPGAADGGRDPWAPPSASVDTALHAARRLRAALDEQLDVTMAALAEERVAHDTTRALLAETEEAYARDRAAWDAERAQLIAEQERISRDAVEEERERAVRDT